MFDLNAYTQDIADRAKFYGRSIRNDIIRPDDKHFRDWMADKGYDDLCLADAFTDYLEAFCFQCGRTDFYFDRDMCMSEDGDGTQYHWEAYNEAA